MSTPEKTASSNAFVRLDPAVRDRLRVHCQAKGLLMGRYVSSIVTAVLDAGGDVPEVKEPRLPAPTLFDRPARRTLKRKAARKARGAKPARKARKARKATKKK